MELFSKNKSLSNEIQGRAIAGKEGALRIVCTETDGRLRAFSGARVMPIVKLSLRLTAEGKTVTKTETDFRGTLYLDDRGDYQCPARLVLLDENGRTLLSSDTDHFEGNAFVVVETGDGGEKALAYSALFHLRATGATRSAVTWGKSKEWLFYADLENELLAGENCGAF